MGKKKVLELPKRSVIERLHAKKAECTPAMVALMDCFRANAFTDEQCSGQMLALQECLKYRTVPKSKHKPSTLFHLIRLYHMRR
mmetsp:Transcript_795/g.2159  ORF Transcript_795/g.2159 Transcript_795/m.2159 type:complete len:84 (+) Transcript_795:2-253(+)